MIIGFQFELLRSEGPAVSSPVGEDGVDAMGELPERRRCDTSRLLKNRYIDKECMRSTKSH